MLVRRQGLWDNTPQGHAKVNVEISRMSLEITFSVCVHFIDEES